MKRPQKPEPKQDSLGRFSRDCPVSTGERVEPGERDLIWFEKLNRHGDLPSPILHDFTKATHKSADYTRRRLQTLWKEKNTPNKGRYLDRPWQRNNTPNVRSNHEIYTLTNSSIKTLKERGLYHAAIPKCCSSWRHDFLRACYSASMELACMQNGLTYIHHDEIIKKIGKDHFTVDREKIRPDVIHGIRYKNGTVRLFLVEIDCVTEPIRSNSKRRNKHFRGSLAQYKKFIGNGIYKEALGMSSGVLLVTVTTNMTHMHNLIEEANSLFKNGCNYMLFGFVPNFEFYFKPPDPLYTLFNEPWLRPGKAPFSMHTV